MEKEPVKARLGLDLLLLRQGVILKVSEHKEEREHQRQAPRKFIWATHGLVRRDQKLTTEGVMQV